ncbi:hypothetical protein SAMN05518672_101997 [Chitinophaga sp. CF118]|uniref:hypothetical protein n=1 Tax=Chitinophaga sp. CF118 TaxID=1884367 RepID=UPI0008EF32B9|nr:hypothetical protein [Chitinophaga sp. CF118]SFD19756.1 hypothetical protein SAMN05518672_101997 [Chitinophaga sp. CF118]
MQANNILSAGRFGAYLKKHLVDNYRFYLMSIVVVTGLLLLLLIFVGITDTHFSHYGDLVPFYLIGLYVSGLIFTSMSFNELGNKPHGIDYLLLPASHLEKFLTTLLITTIGFLLVYHLAFFLAAKVLDTIIGIRTGAHMENDLTRHFNSDEWKWSYIVWFIAQSVFFLGAIYFHKYSLIKTAFFFIVFVLALYLIHAVFAQIFFHKYMDDWRTHIPFVGVNIELEQQKHYTVMVSGNIYHNHVMLMLPEKVRDVLLFMVKYMVAPILWTVAYFRLRDKEI